MSASIHYLSTSSGRGMPRSLIELSVLDEHLQARVAKFGDPKEFHVVLWRQSPDATGCNWNARIERMKVDTARYPSWWDVVPELRERFNLR